MPLAFPGQLVILLPSPQHAEVFVRSVVVVCGWGCGWVYGWAAARGSGCCSVAILSMIQVREASRVPCRIDCALLLPLLDVWRAKKTQYMEEAE